MTPPADLAALRALVEAVDRSEIECLATIHQACLHDLVPAAREELKRVEDILLKDRIKTNEINILTKENREQAARLAQLKEERRHWLDAFERYGHHTRHCGSHGYHPAHKEEHCDCGFNAATSGPEGHPSDTAEWQRVHGAAAQAARDVAHWRTRAENAEARLAQLEGRDE